MSMRAIGRRGGMPAAAIVACAALAWGPGPCPAAEPDKPPPDSVPLPLKGRVTVRAEGKTYVVDGTQTVPSGSQIRLEANVHVVGINHASLEVVGGFEAHGTMGSWVRIDDVDFSPTHAPEGKLHFDMTDLRRCRFVHAETTVYEGGFTLENCCLQPGCAFAVNVKTGFLRIMTTEFAEACKITCVANKGHEPEIAIRTSWMKAVSLVGPGDATVRDAEVKGGLDAKDFTGLEVDGCDVWGGLTFHQGPDGSFSRLVLQKCNLFAGAKITFDRPKGDKTSLEKVKVDKFFFGDAKDAPVTSDKDVAARIVDGADDDAVSVKAFWSKPDDRKHFFVDPKLRERAPPLKR